MTMMSTDNTIATTAATTAATVEEHVRRHRSAKNEDIAKIRNTPRNDNAVPVQQQQHHEQHHQQHPPSLRREDRESPKQQVVSPKKKKNILRILKERNEQQQNYKYNGESWKGVEELDNQPIQWDEYHNHHDDGMADDSLFQYEKRFSKRTAMRLYEKKKQQEEQENKEKRKVIAKEHEEEEQEELNDPLKKELVKYQMEDDEPLYNGFEDDMFFVLNPKTTPPTMSKEQEQLAEAWNLESSKFISLTPSQAPSAMTSAAAAVGGTVFVPSSVWMIHGVAVLLTWMMMKKM